MKKINTDEIIEELIYWNHSDDKERKDLKKLEEQFNLAYIGVNVEKHHELQYTYYFEIDFGKDSSILNVEIENGINNGTRVNSESWDSSTKPDSRAIEELKDVVFNEEGFNRWFDRKLGAEERRPQLRQIAINLFENHKAELLKANRDQSYDNYVTGGGTLKTNQHYKDLYSKLKDKGVFWTFVYEEREVDVNFI